MIAVGTLWLVVKAGERVDLLGLECTVRIIGCPFDHGDGCPCVCGCEFKDGRLLGCPNWAALLPLLDPTIEITAAGVRRMVPA